MSICDSFSSSLKDVKEDLIRLLQEVRPRVGEANASKNVLGSFVRFTEVLCK